MLGNILVNILMAVQIISAIALIILVISQTTKSEGLTGTIGGKLTSSFRGKPGIDEKLADITRWSAGLFFVASLLVYVIKTKLGS